MPRLNDSIRGWRRVTSFSPCKYCSGLAGQIYGPETDTFRSHDKCTCSAEPVYASEERRGGRSRTVAQTRQALKERGVKPPAGIVKQELEDLLDELEEGVEPAVARARAAAAVQARKELTAAGARPIAGAPRAVMEDMAAAIRRGADAELARQQALTQVAELRGMVADKLAEVAVALDADPSARAMSFWARQLRRLSEGADGPGFPARPVPELGVPLRALVQALEAGDAQAARAALPDAVTGSKLKQIGVPNTTTTRSALGGDVEWIGAGRGDAVFVVRPGFSTVVERRTVVAVKPAVQAATPEQIAALGARKAAKAAKKAATKAAPAKKATAAAKAAPKKAPAPKAPPAPERMTAPALRKELADRGVPEALVVDLPKPSLQRFAQRLREGVDPVEEAGRMRLAIVERQRALADALAEASELLDNAATADLLGRRAAQRLARVEELIKGWPQEAAVRALVRAMQGGNPAAIRRAITAAEKRGLTRLGGKAGDTLRYDRKAMSPLAGEKIPDGAPVRVVRPGYEVTIGGRKVTLMRPVVEIDEPAASLADLASRTPTGSRVLGGGGMAETRLLEFGDRKVVEKTYAGRGIRSPEVAAHAVDAEVLSARVAEVLGVRAPRVFEGGDGRLLQDFVESQNLHDYAASIGVSFWDVEGRIVAGAEARRVGLFDYLISNSDRNGGNWLIGVDGRLVAIDHGEAFREIPSWAEPGPFRSWLDRPRVNKAYIRAADLPRVRAALEPLESEFVARRRDDWFQEMMDRLAELEHKAGR